MEEILEVYNSKGKAIGEASCSEVHRKGLWHKVVVGYIINDKLQVLLKRRDRDKQYANLWDASVDGHVVANESVEDSLVRTAKEEFGISINRNMLQHILTDKYKRRECGNKDFQITELFLTRQRVNIDELRIGKQESPQLKWLSLERYISKLKNKDKNYLIHSKNEEKILTTYLIFEKYKKSIIK